MDDGAKDEQESLAMLRESWRQGVRLMAATPHFYAMREGPERFLKRRAEAYERLVRALEGIEDVPEVKCGAEVKYFDGMSQVRDLQKMTIGDTGLLLVEMPFRPWTERMLHEVEGLYDSLGVMPIMAHVNRYKSGRDPNVLTRLQSHGIVIQANAEFFNDWFARGQALRLMDHGFIQVLGSDCHNMRRRAPNLEKTGDILDRRYGEKPLRAINHFSIKLWEGVW